MSTYSALFGRMTLHCGRVSDLIQARGKAMEMDYIPINLPVDNRCGSIVEVDQSPGYIGKYRSFEGEGNIWSVLCLVLIGWLQQVVKTGFQHLHQQDGQGGVGEKTYP